jgi:hypothetical protein
MPQNIFQDFSFKLNAKKVIIKNGGHINKMQVMKNLKKF